MTTPIVQSRSPPGGEGGGGAAPPLKSSASLPPLSSDLTTALLRSDRGANKFSTSSAECTSLKVTPSGRVVVAGFTDGTLRLFPTAITATGAQQEPQQRKGATAPAPAPMITSSASAVVPRPRSTSDDDPVLLAGGGGSGNGNRKRRGVQASSNVAAQIVSKGVHTSLLMDVDVTPDGLWAFAGVLRGSMELVALHLGHLEAAMDDHYEEAAARMMAKPTAPLQPPCWSEWMDTLTVYKQVDAKLRGFGACTCLDGDRYLLLTGKAIKNIHIWSFAPPKGGDDRPVWTQLYDTQTNGNTIKWLSFHVNPSTGSLSALSKSDGQKLRVWDLSLEQQEATTHASPSGSGTRPARPPFVDVANTEGMLGVAGGYAICGGASESMYHQVGLVNLNRVGDLQSPFNHTELALPPSSSHEAASSGESGSAPPALPPRRRQQRGDLKSVERVAGIEGQALLELSDGNLVQFQSAPGQGQPVLTWLGRALPAGFSRQVCVARVASCGLAVAATAVFNPAKGRGWIRIWPMEGVEQRLRDPYRGDWGFRGVPTIPKPIRGGKSHSSQASKKFPVEVPKSKIAAPPASVVKAVAPPTAVASIHKENRPQALAAVSIVTPRLNETVAPGASSAASISAGRPYRVSLEPVRLDRTIDENPNARDRGADAKELTGKRRKSDGSMENRGDASTAPDGSARRTKRRSMEGGALAPAAPSDSSNSTYLYPLEPPPGPAKNCGDHSAIVVDEARHRAPHGPASTAPGSTAPKRPNGEIQRGGTAGIRASVAPLVATQIGDGTLPSVKFKSPMRRDKKRSNKDDVPTQSQIAKECERRMGVLEQLIKDCPVHRSPLLQENSTSSSATSLVERHEFQRQNLLLAQGAAYERFIKSILHHAVQTLDWIVQSPTTTTLNEARDTWTAEIDCFEQLEEERAQQHALELDGLLSRQLWECQTTPHVGSTPLFAGDASSPSRADVQSILLQLRDCIPQFGD